MKRIHIAYMLLLITGAICFTQFIFIYKCCNNYEKHIDNIEAAYKNEDYVTAQKLSYELKRKWKKTSKYADMFLFHDYIDDITDNIDKMIIYIN